MAISTAVWYHSGKPPMLLRWVLIRDPHKCCEPQALPSINMDHTPQQILTRCIRRWTMAVTCEEARVHLGMETQRWWNERAIARTTPALLSLYTIIMLTAHQLLHRESIMYPTFADAIALVRRHLWDYLHFSTSPYATDMIKIPRVLFDRFIDVVCSAA